jgi:hypothetical protein
MPIMAMTTINSISENPELSLMRFSNMIMTIALFLLKVSARNMPVAEKML